MRPVEYFSRDVHTFWANTFQFDLKLFDQFLLRRLGDAPLNSVVMCDEDCLTDALLGLSDVDEFLLAAANRRYLLRGVKVASGGRFHPKTFLFASRRQTTLLVGSGNLTRSGLDRGRETFVAYDASVAGDLPVMRSWARWMRNLVAAQGDPVLTRRFEHLQLKVPELEGPAGDPVFLVNDEESLLEQIRALAPDRVAELHVRAPYYDKGARAFAELIRVLAPKKALHVYLDLRTNVDGRALRSVLKGAGCRVFVHGHEPEEFVHAKLIGVIGTNGKGVLFCGSANLSRAALINTYSSTRGSGNCEILVARPGSAKEIAQAFLPRNTTPVNLSLDDVQTLEFVSDEDATRSWPLRLRSAVFLPDDRIRVNALGDLTGCAVAWNGLPTDLPLRDDSTTLTPVPEDQTPETVWLVDANGERCSNPVVVDDRDALDKILATNERGSDRPPELRDEEGGSQLVSLLVWANQQFIFDIDDTGAIRRTNNAQEIAPDGEDAAFWERYARDELSYDPRSQTYRRLAAAAALTETGLLLQEIEAMLHAAPANRRLRLIGTSNEPEDGAASRRGGHSWSFTARERLRARNLLRRWAHALADPRHAWLSPKAPAHNYQALLELLSLISLARALEDDRIRELLGETWSSFIGTDQRQGFLQRADTELAAETLQTLDDKSGQLAAGLAYASLHEDTDWQEWIYEWQPFLKRGLAEGIFAAGPLSIKLVHDLKKEKPSAKQIETLLKARAEWIDDLTWGKRAAEEFRLKSVRIVPHAGFRNVSVVLQIEGLRTPARDPRLISLARRLMALKHSDHVLIVAGEQRFLLRLGEGCVALIDGHSRTSVAPIDEARLAAVEEHGGTLAELLGIAA